MNDYRSGRGRLRLLAEYTALLGAVLSWGVFVAILITVLPKDLSLPVLSILIVVAVVARVAKRRSIP